MYRRSTYKFGSKTLLEIINIPTANLQIGDSVFNTDWKIPEFWTGDVWTNEHCIVATATEGFLGGEGCHWVRNTVTGIAELGKATTSTKYRFAGVCVRGASIGNPIVVAIKGRWPVRFDETVTRGEYVNLSGTGTFTANTTSGAGTVGMVLESLTYSGLPIYPMCYINGIEKY